MSELRSAPLRGDEGFYNIRLMSPPQRVVGVGGSVSAVLNNGGHLTLNQVVIGDVIDKKRVNDL